MLFTVADFIEALSRYPADWPVHVVTPAGGDVAIECREIGGNPIIGIFGKNGGRFGESPFTEDEYKERAQEFTYLKLRGYLYTSKYGDHRLYFPGSPDDSRYGIHFDPRVIDRMVSEGLLDPSEVDQNALQK